jgi:uncharacterized iron-regulated protein
VKTYLRFIFGIALLLSTAVSAHAAGKIVRASDNARMDFGPFVTDLGRSDVIFIGDTHDDTLLHARQLEIIRAVYAGNHQLAIGLEMFTTDNQRYLDDWSQGKLEEKEFVAIYRKNWTYDWSLYRDLFIFARDNHLPMVALNVPKAVVSKLVRGGGSALSASEKQELPPGPWALHPRQADYLRRIRAQVFGDAPSPIPRANFDEAQALRNDNIAFTVAKYREKSPKSKVVVLAGTWHAIKNGAPESLKKFGKNTSSVVLPDLVEFSWLKPTAEDMDYLIPRGDQ